MEICDRIWSGKLQPEYETASAWSTKDISVRQPEQGMGMVEQ
jgi:hypothetical protein